MSHGLAALCFTLTLSLALKTIEGETTWHHRVGGGLALGLLFATRPVTALGLGLTLCFIAGSSFSKRLICSCSLKI